MCEIDKELVLRGAAHFATYAAGREPPRLDEFTARLIERALRSKVVKEALPTPIVEKPIKLPRRQAELVEFLRHRHEGGTAAEIAEGMKINNGNVHFFIASAMSKGFVSQGANGKYFAAVNPPSVGPVIHRPSVRAVSPVESEARIDRLLALLRKDPAKKFSPTELAEKCDIPSPSHSGALHGLLNRMMTKGLVAKAGKGLYGLGRKGASA